MGLGVFLLAASMCGGEVDKASEAYKALMCNTNPDVGSTYPLGCVGDGRADHSTTSCGKDAYSYFNVAITLVGMDISTRLLIDDCQLQIADSKGKELTVLTLPQGQGMDSGMGYGCAFNATPTFIGLLNYSSCIGKDQSLVFRFTAKTSASGAPVALAQGVANAYARPGNSISVDLSATKL